MIYFSTAIATAQAENGFISLQFNMINDADTAATALVNIMRSSDDAEYAIICSKEMTIDANAKISYTIQDFSAEIGVPYYYLVATGGESSKTNLVLLPGEGYMFISTPESQMRLVYDITISGLKYNYVDTITPTLGSEYPFIRRNGYQKYRTFTLGGLLSFSAEDANSLFFKTSEFNPKLYTSLSEFDRTHIYEKLFRDRALQFLTAPDIKLIRTQEEGIMLVRLTNISLTPKKELGRMIYSFSCQATECKAATVQNIIQYCYPLRVREVATVKEE